MPGRAAYMDGRRGSSSMRLNFAGVPEQDIREGIRRIGRGVRDQLGLLGTLTGSPVAPSNGRRQEADSGTAARRARGGWRRGARAAGRRRQAPPPARTARRHAAAAIDERSPPGRGPQGRPLARAQRLAALGRPGPGRRCTGLGHEVVAIDVGETFVPELLERERPRSRSSRCTAAKGRTGPSRRCWRRCRSPTPAPGRRPACAPPTRCWPSS